MLRPAARRTARSVGFALASALGIGFKLFGRERTRHAGGPWRILGIRLERLGDVLFCFPAISALRTAFPDARITMLTLPYTAPLAGMCPDVDDVLAVDTNLIRRPHGLLRLATWRAYARVVRRLRAQSFDVAISAHGRMGSLWALLSGAARRVGYDGEAYPFTLTARVDGGRFRERIHDSEYVLRLAAAAGASSSNCSYRLRVPEEALRTAKSKLAAAGISVSDRFVVIHAGSTNGSAKRWPPHSWSDFAGRIAREIGVRSILVGAASDEPIAREVLARSFQEVVSLVGQTTIAELAAVIARASLVASGDSGPLHLAAALGRPLVAVYGPTDPAVHGPYRPSAPVRIHRQDLACSPCYTLAAMADCPLGDPICMRLVSVAQMVRSARELLESGPKHRP